MAILGRTATRMEGRGGRGKEGREREGKGGKGGEGGSLSLRVTHLSWLRSARAQTSLAALVLTSSLSSVKASEACEYNEPITSHDVVTCSPSTDSLLSRSIREVYIHSCAFETKRKKLQLAQTIRIFMATLVIL